MTHFPDTTRTAEADHAGVSAPAWIFAVLRVAGHFGIGASPEHLRQTSLRSDTVDVKALARDAGLVIREIPSNLTALNLPVAAVLEDGQLAVIETETAGGFVVALSGDNGLATDLSHDELRRRMSSLYALRPATNRPDRRIDNYIGALRPDWLRKITLASPRSYRAIAIASLIGNLLSLSGILFSMQVYDRVIPAQSLPTLWVLFGGVILAVVFGYLMRMARNRVGDRLGRAADLQISDKVFGHALRVRSDMRPRATGTFISQIRDLDHIREMMTSTTITAVADLPFFVLFAVMFWQIAGGLVWIPLAAAILLLLPGILAQPKLKRFAQENLRESAIRNALLVEIVHGLDDIKSMQAEARFQNLWNHANDVISREGMRLRNLVNALSAWGQSVQAGVFAVVIFFGAPLVMSGEMSTGVLVAASMLSSRMIAPLGSVAQILNRWQQAKVARQGIEQLLALPTDTPEAGHRIHHAVIKGEYRLEKAVFAHSPDLSPVLKVKALHIAPGERIGILGRNGAGKSTLLAGLSGLLPPVSGDVRLDGVALGLLDPADVRRDIGWISQNARLFHGTLRENLRLGAPQATDDELLRIISDLALDEFLSGLSAGLDHEISEGGTGLSGGQKQGILLARLMLRRPRLLLLDEPTAALDDMAENTVINTLGALPSQTGFIVATHRPALLRIVNRLIVVSRGNIVLDGPKDEVLAKLRGGKSVAA